MDGQRGALEQVIASRFGDEWRNYPALAGADLEWVARDRGWGWRSLRHAFHVLVREAGLDARDSVALVRPVLDLLAPGGVDPAPLERPARALAAGMANAKSQRTAPAVAALDAVLALVATGDAALPIAHGQIGIQAATLAQAWPEANALLASLLADCLADVAQSLFVRYGPGAVGTPVPPDAVPWRDTSELRASLANHYLDPAAFYIRWQQDRTCECHPGKCTARMTPKHHLHGWQPGLPGQAGDLSTWFRTWVAGARHKGALPVKAFSDGLFYRHLLPSLPGTTIDVIVGEVLAEVCVVPTCPAHGGRAHRLTMRDPVSAVARGHRVCPVAEDHDLDFAYSPDHRPREVVLVGNRSPSHLQYDHLAWNRDIDRWYFRERRGSARWVPFPHGLAFQHLGSRNAYSNGAAVPEVPYRRRDAPPDWDWGPPRAGDLRPAGPPLGPRPVDQARMEEVNAILDEVVDQVGDSPGLFAAMVTALRPTGQIDVGPACHACACEAPEGGTRDFCDAALGEVLRLFLEHAPARSGSSE